jgi:hypothetical protein
MTQYINAQWLVTLYSDKPGCPFIDIKMSPTAKLSERIFGQALSGVEDVYAMEVRIPINHSTMFGALGLASDGKVTQECIDGLYHEIPLCRGDVFILKAWGKPVTVRHIDCCPGRKMLFVNTAPRHAATESITIVGNVPELGVWNPVHKPCAFPIETSTDVGVFVTPVTVTCLSARDVEFKQIANRTSKLAGYNNPDEIKWEGPALINKVVKAHTGSVAVVSHWGTKEVTVTGDY